MREPLPLQDEADIGSGAKTPGQQETEKMIEEVGQKRVPQTPVDNESRKDVPQRD